LAHPVYVEAIPLSSALLTLCPIVISGYQKPQNLPFPMGISTPSNSSFFGLTPLPQMAWKSAQSVFHKSLDIQTDQLTDTKSTHRNLHINSHFAR